MKLVIQIPCYNEAASLPLTIAQLPRDVPGCDTVEWLVIDDGSDDDTPELLARYGDQIRVVRQQNRGVAASRNLGASLASGELLAFLDADDVWAPRKLALQAKRYEEEAGLGLVHCGLLKIDAAGKVLAECASGSEGDVAIQMLREIRSIILAGGSGALIPRSVFDEVGGFDERLSTSADWDLFYRIARTHRVAFVPEALYKYRLHGRNMHRDARTLERDMLLVYDKAFASAPSTVQSYRNACYGQLHALLAGAFFADGDIRNFLRHATASIAFAPGNLVRFGALPALRCRQFLHGRATRLRARESTYP